MDSKNKKIVKEGITEELYLRDYLATDRTLLAIDRTLLSYVRTALTMFVAGVSFLKFFDTLFIHALGWVFIVMAVLTSIIGAQRCLQSNKLINKRKAKNKIFKPVLLQVDVKEQKV